MDDRSRLEKCFREALGLGDDVDLGQTAYGTTTAWDSLAHMQLVAALETEFEVMLDTDEVIAMSDFGIIVATLRDHHGLEL